MSATLTVTREGFGIELRRGSFQVSVDDEHVGTLNYGETLEKPLEPGRHALRVRVGRYSSRTLSFEAGDGPVVRFRCHGPMVWPRYVASLIKPDIGVTLRHAS